MDLAALKALCKPDRIAITEHARLRLVERGITVSDIICCIASGEIIEQYEDDKPFPSFEAAALLIPAFAIWVSVTMVQPPFRAARPRDTASGEKTRLRA